MMSADTSKTLAKARRKRPHTEASSQTNRSSKRRDTSFKESSEYTAEEQTTLERAASILGVSVDDLIAYSRPTSNISTTDISNSPPVEADSNTVFFRGLSTPDIAPFDLRLPDFTNRRARSRIPTTNNYLSDPNIDDQTRDAPMYTDSCVSWLSAFATANQDGGMELLEPPPFVDNWELSLCHNPIWEHIGLDDSVPNPPSRLSIPTPTCYDEESFGPPILTLLSVPGRASLRSVDNFSESRSDRRIQSSFTTDEPSIQGTPPLVSNGKSGVDGKADKPRRRGRFEDPRKRCETGRTRKDRACLRCRIQRVRCVPDPSDPTGYCLTCIMITGQTLSNLPCLRYKISDAQLIDHGTCPRASWSRRWEKMEMIDIKDWRSSEIKIISITQDVGGMSYNLKTREFIPIEGDALERKWMTNGEQQSFKCAPYAIENMKEAGRTLNRFVDGHIGSSICYYIDETDTLLRDTYSMAYRYSIYAENKEERDLLKCVLRLWCASRMESRSDRICSTECLNMEAQHYEPTCPNSGNILVPPVINAQIEIIMTVMVLIPMKKAVLKGLQDLFRANRRGSWFAIYLCMFILLHSCALLTSADNERAKKQGMKSRFFRHSLVEDLHDGAKILLAHFHYCNKGNHPFTMDWAKRKSVEQAAFNVEQALFMQVTCEQIKAKATRFQAVKDNRSFENELYFLAQLYELDWKPVHTI